MYTISIGSHASFSELVFGMKLPVGFRNGFLILEIPVAVRFRRFANIFSSRSWVEAFLNIFIRRANGSRYKMFFEDGARGKSQGQGEGEGEGESERGSCQGASSARTAERWTVVSLRWNL